MSTYDNSMSGTLGKNKRKENDRAPGYKGKCEIDGKEYWISAWVRESQGEKFFSLKFEAKDAPKTAPRQTTGTGFDNMDSDGPPF